MGMSEIVYNPEKGLIWALMPFQYSLSFIIGKSSVSVPKLKAAHPLEGPDYHCQPP